MLLLFIDFVQWARLFLALAEVNLLQHFFVF